MSDQKDLEVCSRRARVAVLERMMAYLMRRLGAEKAHIQDWLKRPDHLGDQTDLYGALNVILGSLKPPPRKDR
jgi:hypothetical protein